MTWAPIRNKALFCICALLLLPLAGCYEDNSNADIYYESYKDIPGITSQEISDIEELLLKKPVLVFGYCESPESFILENGETSGFFALLCQRMSQLTGFEFEYDSCGWEELNSKLLSGEVDLTGELTPTPERKEKLLMTEPIVQRVIEVYTNKSAPSLYEIAQERPVVYAFLDGSTVFDEVKSGLTPPYELVFADEVELIPSLFESGEIDAFIEEGIVSFSFSSYDFIEGQEYYPLAYSPVSLTTGNEELHALISVMEKYIAADGSFELMQMYKDGTKQYDSFRLFNMLTEEEKQYISNHNSKETAVKAAYETDSYPVSFYNKKEGEFQGIAIDTLAQIEELTGLEFEPVNPTDSTRKELMQGLTEHEYAFISTLIRTSQRENDYLWAKSPYDETRFALISLESYPDVDINKVLYSKVGAIDGTSYKEAYLNWFPQSEGLKVYSSNEEAVRALETGEIELLMGSLDVLLHITNYLEKTDFKANGIFHYYAESYFTFNKDEAILCSIVDKAQQLVDVSEISDAWKRRLFDYDSKMFKDVFPYIILFIILLAAGIATIFYFLIKNRRINKRLEELVEQRTSELAVQGSLLETVFGSIPDLIFTKDTNQKFLSCNKSFERHFNITADQIIGKGDVDGLNFPEELAKKFEQRNELVIKEGRISVIEEMIPSADGREPWFETVQIPLRKGDNICGIVGISRDITERKAEEETLKVTLDNLNTCIYISEIDTGKILFINEKMAAEFGGKAKDFMGKTCYKVLQDNFDEQCEFCPVPKLQKSGDDYYTWEEHNTVTGRHYKNMDALIRWPGGKTVHMQHSVDVTDQVKMQIDLEHASRAKSDFLSRMSHEMRTPLSAIIGMNNIAMNTDDIDKIRHCHDRINGASRSLLGIINDILDMSKIEANKFELSLSEFDLDKMLMNITNIINQRADEKHQELVVSLNQDVPMFVRTDELRLSQVITNLLSNAVKFTPEGGTIVVSVNKTDEDDEQVTLRFEVADNGIGITEEQKQRLFTSFEQADSSISRRFGGTGLGLAISKRIVELMGGQIWVESDYGKGSVFIFTIKAQKAKQKLADTLTIDINMDNINILAVDDCQETLDYFAHVMQSHKLPFTVARSGEEAIAIIDESADKPFNMFFVDWKMPGMDGVELSKRIKEITGDKSVIFMISVADWNAVEKEATAAGVDRFITKPLFASTLINSINECISSNRQEADNSRGEIFGQHKYPGHTILIAEDIEINREIMSAVFEETEAAIEFAEDGIEAVRIFKESPQKFSMILMDIHMPRMDGFEATRTIRSIDIDRAREIPIVAMTANVFREDIENCLEAGMNDHIGKPVEAEDLFNKLDKYLLMNKKHKA